MLNRRKLITGLVSFVAAPAIVRASSLMPVKVMDSFDPKEALDRLVEYSIAEYKGEYSEIDPIRLYWLSDEGLKILPIEQSDAYLRNLDDNSRTISER